MLHKLRLCAVEGIEVSDTNSPPEWKVFTLKIMMPAVVPVRLAEPLPEFVAQEASIEAYQKLSKWEKAVQHLEDLAELWAEQLEW